MALDTPPDRPVPPPSAFWPRVWTDLDTQHLPGDLRVIAGDTSMMTARQLVETFGGRQPYIPARSRFEGVGIPLFDAFDEVAASVQARHLPGDLKEIAERLDTDLALYFARTWAGSLIYVPTRSKILKIHRDLHLLDAWDGTNTAALARRYEVSPGEILRSVREAAKDDQGDLFDEG